VVEVAVGFLGAYLLRKAEGVVARAGDEADAAFDRKLAVLYDWTKGKLTGRPYGERSLRLLEKLPEDVDSQDAVGAELAQVVAGAAGAQQELAELIAELERLRPAGLSIRGEATSTEVAEGGSQAGVVAEGPLPDGSVVVGTANTGTVRGNQAGAVYRS
jgi:hypothetical protein